VMTAKDAAAWAAMTAEKIGPKMVTSSFTVLAPLIPKALCCRKISITLEIALRPRKA